MTMAIDMVAKVEEVVENITPMFTIPLVASISVVPNDEWREYW